MNAAKVVSPAQVCASHPQQRDFWQQIKVGLGFGFFVFPLWGLLPSMMSAWGFMNPDKPLIDKTDQNGSSVVGWSWCTGTVCRLWEILPEWRGGSRVLKVNRSYWSTYLLKWHYTTLFHTLQLTDTTYYFNYNYLIVRFCLFVWRYMETSAVPVKLR